MLLIRLAILQLAALAAGQTGDVAKQVYNSSQESVFLVYLNDSSGAPSALGSAFLIAPRTLVTNAHVVEAGSPVLAVGPVRIPLKILRKDQKNDLALLSVDVDLTSKPLPLASGEVVPGEQVFAIGNPEGLEKTISQGIVSGLRNRDDRNLLQITSPISHGSSGGPILNEKGEVVGVAVGMLEDGQNLNFAVPVLYVRTILARKDDEPSRNFDLAASLDQIRATTKKKDQAEYSTDPSSDYQQSINQLLNLTAEVIDASTREDALTELACLGTKEIELSDKGIEAARKLVKVKPTAENRALLSYILYKRAESEGLAAQFAKKDSDEQAQAVKAHNSFMSDASREAAGAAKIAKADSLSTASFVLGSAKEDSGNNTEAISLHALVAKGNPTVCGDDLKEEALRALISESDEAKRPDDAERWFRQFAGLYGPASYEWDSEGDRRFAAQDYGVAADAYERAAKGLDYYSYDYCYATKAHFLQPVRDPDGVLSDGRKCVEASVKQTGKQGEQYFTAELPIVYSDMANVLEERGVYQPALEYIRESLSAKPDNPLALHTEAKILEDLQRYSECIAAAKAAIQASDGKYAFMQFQLGQCYFDVEDWSHAEASYRLAAEADRSDAASAFNLALSLSRQGYNSDANDWLRETLRRNPSEELRAKVMNLLK